MIEKPDVNVLLAGPLGGWLEQQATVREDAKRLARERWRRAAIWGLPALLVLWIVLPSMGEFKFWGTFIAIGGAYAWGDAPRRAAVRTVKTGINDAIASALHLEYEHDPQPGPGFELCETFGVVPSHDRASFEDQWSGEVSGRNFLLHEAHLEERRGSGKNERWETVFRGAIMAIGFTRRFHGTTLLERAERHRGWFGGRKESVEFGGKRLDYVDMVHPGFEDTFAVWSDDQVEARYLIHPAYIERLIGVEQAFHGKNIRTLFCGGELLIAVEMEDMFESGSIDARDDRVRIERTVEQFASLADLAAVLNEPERGF